MKTYNVTVGTRRRITVPYDAWMDARCPTLRIQEFDGQTLKYKPGICLQKNMSYRFTLGKSFKFGDRLILSPDPANHQIKIQRAI